MKAIVFVVCKNYCIEEMVLISPICSEPHSLAGPFFPEVNKARKKIKDIPKLFI